jgi:hypothetical protein
MFDIENEQKKKELNKFLAFGFEWGKISNVEKHNEAQESKAKKKLMDIKW